MPRKLVQRQFVVGRFPTSPPAATIVEAWRQIIADDALRSAIELPGRLLTDYFRDRGRSRLGRLVEAANRWAEWCETLIVVAKHDAAESARALVGAIAHPYYNQLSHGGRGGRPALVVIEPTLDNDRLQGVLDLVESSDRWGLAVESSAATNATAAPFFARLGDDAERRSLVVESSSSMFFADVAMFATSLVGADVVAVLKGGVWFHERSKSDLAAENDAVRLADFLAAEPTQLVVWHDALFSLAQQLAAGVSPSLAVSRAYENSARRRLLQSPGRHLHLYSEVVRRDRLTAAAGTEPTAFITSDDAVAGHCVPAPTPLVMAYDEVRAAESAAGTASADIHLSRLNDMAIGELCAWFETVTLIAEHNGRKSP